MRNRRTGVAFILVIAVIAIIIIAALFFMSSTIEHGRQASLSVQGLHANCLAEAAIERTVRIICEDANDPGILGDEDGDPESVAVLLRLPRKKSGKKIEGLKDNLGADELLDLTDSNEIVYDLEDLRYKEEGEDELDKLVEFMTRGSAKDYDVNVTIKINKAFHVGPGKDDPEYQVPGIDTTWAIRPDVRSFLDGEGYVGFFLKIPEDVKVIGFTIPIKFMGFKIVEVNAGRIIDVFITNLIKTAAPTFALDVNKYLYDGLAPDGSGEGYLGKLLSLDFLANMIINKFLWKDCKPPAYPIKIMIDSDLIPTTIAELWPPGVFTENDAPKVEDSFGMFVEKYGELEITCEASITSQDGHVAKRRIECVKEFRVSDVEPPAPMYSLFISNDDNNYLHFNYLGGDLFVNNQDLSGLLGRFKNAKVPGFFDLSKKSAEEANSAVPVEIPGLIRINYSGPNEKSLVVKAAMFGDPFAGTESPIDKDDGFFKALARGCDALLVLNTNFEANIVNAEHTISADFNTLNKLREKLGGKKKKPSPEKNSKPNVAAPTKGLIIVTTKEQKEAQDIVNNLKAKRGENVEGESPSSSKPPATSWEEAIKQDPNNENNLKNIRGVLNTGPSQETKNIEKKSKE
ncbi:hypothetical protein HYY75_03355 [bacterium]|nr:hypothetical protein [bacterium]